MLKESLSHYHPLQANIQIEESLCYLGQVCFSQMIIEQNMVLKVLWIFKTLRFFNT